MQFLPKINGFFENLFDVMPGGIFGIMAVTIGLLGIIIPLMHYPDYNIFKDMVSHLGTP